MALAPRFGACWAETSPQPKLATSIKMVLKPTEGRWTPHVKYFMLISYNRYQHTTEQRTGCFYN
ncbi:MAG TPA: hypothetical protein DCS31_05335 [Candidatus Competibacteraceae bacterium]|nr:hypothetical protein [Candidatus Competibacteraceae bacterium]